MLETVRTPFLQTASNKWPSRPDLSDIEHQSNTRHFYAQTGLAEEEKIPVLIVLAGVLCGELLVIIGMLGRVELRYYIMSTQAPNPGRFDVYN
jgi:hypothetical protein